MSELIEYLSIRNAYDKATRRQGQRRRVPRSEIVAMLTKSTMLRDKLQGLGFAPLTMHDEPCTCAAEDCLGELGHFIGPNVLAFNLIVLDVDKYRDGRQLDQAGAERAMARLRELKLWHCVYSTYNHAYPDHASLRGVLAPSRPVLREEWGLFFPALSTWLGIDYDAKTSKTVGRLWFLPSHPPGVQPIAYSVDGAVVDVDMIMELARAAQAVIPPKESTSRSTSYTPLGNAFSIRELIATEYPGARSKSGGGNISEKLHIGGKCCPWTSEHTSPNHSTDTTIIIFTSGAWDFVCQHSHCEGRGYVAFRKHHQPDWEPYDPSRPKQRSPSEPIPSEEHPNGPNGPRVNGYTAVDDETAERLTGRERSSDPPPSRPPDEPPDIGEPAGPANVPVANDESDAVKSKHANTPKLPVIKVGTNMREVVDQAQRALLARGGIYVRGMRMAHVIRDWSAPKYLDVPHGLPVIARLSDATLREIMSNVAQWEKRDERGKRDKEWKCTIPPDWAAKTLAAREEWPFPVIEGISEAPILRTDGTILDTPGYDSETRWIFAPSGPSWPTIPRSLTKADAQRAYAELVEPLCDMAYVSESDRAASASLILSIVGRAAIRGPVPAHMATANTPGAAKTLLIDTCSIIATGREASKMPVTHDDNEMRKRMLPIAVAGVAIVSIDNIEGSFGSECLAMALTSNTWRDRKLGLSEDSGDVPFRSVLAFTGNNIQLTGDLGRRVVPIRFDPKMEHPEDRTGFRYPDLRGHVSEHRPRLYSAALTVLAAYLRSPDKRQPGGKGSFEHWDAVVRGAIVWASGQDLDEGMQELRRSGDHDLERLRTLVAEMRKLGSLQDATTATILDVAKNNANLQTAIDAYAIKSDPMTTKRLGAMLAKLAGRPVCLEYEDSTGKRVRKLHRIVKGDDAGGGVARWRIEEVTP